MNVLSRLDHNAARDLSRALRTSWTLRNTTCLRELRDEARRQEFNVVVLDPLDAELLGRDGRRSSLLFDSVYRALGLPVVFLAPMQTETFIALAQMARVARVEVLFRQTDGHIDSATTTLERVAGARLATRVFCAIREATAGGLSSQALFTVEQLFHRPGAFMRIGTSLRELGISQPILNAELKRVGLCPFHILRRLARIAHAHELVVEFGVGLKEVVERVGAGSIDTLCRETKLLTLHAPAAMCATTRDRDLVHACVRAARLDCDRSLGVPAVSTGSGKSKRGVNS